MFDYLVVGKGLMGSAAFRYLTQESGETAVLGPDEPRDSQTHRGVFGAHYDQARITHQLSSDPVNLELNRRATAQFRAIEAESGISFYYPVGCLYVESPAEDAYSRQATMVGERLGISFNRASVAEIEAQFPFLHFPADYQAVFEPDPAGHINPRTLIEAQVAIGEKNGGRVIRETAVSINQTSTHFNITTMEGNQYQSRKVLLATGAFSNCFELLPHPLPLRFKTETVILGKLPKHEVARLQNMPSVIYKIDAPTIDSIYMLPPVLYPDGNIYVKLGCNTNQDQWINRLEEMQAWYAHGNSDLMSNDMKAALYAILPALEADSIVTSRCVITYTTHGNPYIDALNDRLFVATGGNGSAAKSSDAIGHLAAQLTINGQWEDDLNHEHFRIR